MRVISELCGAGIIKGSRLVSGCMHRFCTQCIEKWLRMTKCDVLLHHLLCLAEPMPIPAASELWGPELMLLDYLASSAIMKAAGHITLAVALCRALIACHCSTNMQVMSLGTACARVGLK